MNRPPTDKRLRIKTDWIKPRHIGKRVDLTDVVLLAAHRENTVTELTVVCGPDSVIESDYPDMQAGEIWEFSDGRRRFIRNEPASPKLVAVSRDGDSEYVVRHGDMGLWPTHRIYPAVGG